jgi:hypothetical protein
MPYGFKLTKDGNILALLHDVPQLEKNLKFLKGGRRLPGKYRDEYNQLFDNDTEVWEAFRQYRVNTANGMDGQLGLDDDPSRAIRKKNFLNALHGAIDAEHINLNPILSEISKLKGMDMFNPSKRQPFGPATKTFRLDRIFDVTRSGNRNSNVNVDRAKKLLMPAEADVQITDKLFMPASEAGAGKGKIPKSGDMLTLDDKSLKLFLPSPGNPNASLSDFKGKNVQVLTTDLSMVGDKKIDGATVAFTGGPGYLSVNDAWGFTNESSAKGFRTRWEREGRPLIGLTSMKQDNHKASTLTREYYVRKFMQAINQGKIAEKEVNNFIKAALKKVIDGKNGLTKDQKVVLGKVKTIEDFLTVFTDKELIPWKASPFIYEKLNLTRGLPIKQTRLKELGLDLDTILRETRQSEYNDIKKGSLLAIAEYDGSDAVYRPDLNSAYPWSVPFKEKAFLKDFADIQDLSSRQDLRGSDGEANIGVAMGAGIMLDKLGRGDVNFMPSGQSTRQPANRITRQAPAMPGNRFMLPAASAGARLSERFR